MAGCNLAMKLKYLESCVGLTKPPDITLEELINASKRFPIPIPVIAVCCEALQHEYDIEKNTLERNINSTYPIIHESVVSLYIRFLDHKKNYGSHIEKALYADMNLVTLVHRFLEKRAVTFCGSADFWILLDNSRGVGGWDKVGTVEETSDLCLSECLSYDEMKLSALLSVSSHSTFINNGARRNRGEPVASYDIDSIERHGVVVGLIGPRFGRVGALEWQEIIISKEQNTVANGYGPKNNEKRTSGSYWIDLIGRTLRSMFPHKTYEPALKWRQIWSDFYDLKPYLPLYREVICNDRYVNINPCVLNGLKFDNEAYAKRLYISFETLLLDANHRAKLEENKAYVHVVGIGLGVWKISSHQETVFLDAFASCLTRLLPHLSNISDVNFSWFNNDSCGGVANGELCTKEGTPNKIRILFSKRNPHERLIGEDSGKLVVVSYAWDGNSLPGNEFWAGSLDTSGDPAEASSSQVAELHNAHINCGKVSGNNLHIATAEWGVIHVSEYATKILNMHTMGDIK